MAELYAALPLSGRNQVRRLRILPNLHSKSIACELQVIELGSDDHYIAVSYTWGSAALPPAGAIVDDPSGQPNIPILCRADIPGLDAHKQAWHEILVTENLYAFLCQMQSHESTAHDFYWIDAICINQNDPDERTSQVKLMAEVYQSASKVYAWLGEADETTGSTFKLISALSRRCSGSQRRIRIQALNDITPAGLGTGELVEKLGTCANETSWRALAWFFERRYFTRVWTIQEITLAKTLIAYCGSHTIAWEHIVKVSEFLTLSPWTAWFADVTGSHARHHFVPNILDANKTSTNLLYSLIRCRRFLSKDPRDKIYALLGVAEESVRGKERLNPVYGDRSTEETFTLAAVQILKDSDDLLLLSCAEGECFRSFPSLPSWVPDWSCSHTLGLGVTGYTRFSAAGDIPRSLQINEQERTLVVQGFRLDDIVLAGEAKQEVLAHKPFPKWRAILNTMDPVYHTGELRAEVFWRTLIADTSGSPPRFPAMSSYRSSYNDWIEAKLLASFEAAGEEPSSKSPFTDALELFIAHGDSSDREREAEYTPQVESRHRNRTYPDAADSNDYGTTFSYSRYLRPLFTGRKYLGVGSQSLREQDSVWIVAGSRVPLILRQVDADVFSIVGGAYVHGFMRGEALNSEHCFESIVIE